MSRIHPLVARLQARRLELGLSQQAIADACGVHVTTVSRWDTGQKDPSLENLVAYAQAVNLEIKLQEADSRPAPEAIRRRRDVLREVELAVGNADMKAAARPRTAGTGERWQGVASASTQEAAQADAADALTWALKARELLGKVLVHEEAGGLRRALVALAAAVVAWLEELDGGGRGKR